MSWEKKSKLYKLKNQKSKPKGMLVSEHIFFGFTLTTELGPHY